MNILFQIELFNKLLSKNIYLMSNLFFKKTMVSHFYTTNVI